MSGLGAGSGGGGSMNNLTTLIKRLEAATSRLEDIAASAGPSDDINGSHDSQTVRDDDYQHSQSAPEVQIPALGGVASREASTTTVRHVEDDIPASVKDMDAMLEDEVKAFVSASSGLDKLIDEQARAVAKAFADQRRFILVSTKAKKPDPQSKAFMDLLTDLQDDMGVVGDVRDSNRASAMKEHLAMVGEGVAALQWLIMDEKPADYVGEVIGGAQMYGNRVLKEYRESDQSHVKFVQAYYALLKALQAYIRKHYASGLKWNEQGQSDVLAAYEEAESGPAPNANGARSPATGGAPPPPPPPPPLPTFDNSAQPSSSAASSTKAVQPASSSDMGAVFEQLNRGESVTSGLKKVDKSQMTHKNPSLRAESSTVPNESSRSRSPGPEVKPKPPSMRQNSTSSQQQKPASASDSSKPTPQPQKELDGNKWLISNHNSPAQPVEIDVSLSQSILITKCTATTIILRGKANAISIDNSPKLQLLVDTLVSSIDVIKCAKFAVQITGAVPTVLLDQVDGAQIFLGEKSLATEVFTSKCSGVNVVLPPTEEEGEKGDSRECPVPEQMRTVVEGGKLRSEIVEHAG